MKSVTEFKMLSCSIAVNTACDTHVISEFQLHGCFYLSQRGWRLEQIFYLRIDLFAFSFINKLCLEETFDSF